MAEPVDLVKQITDEQADENKVIANDPSRNTIKSIIKNDQDNKLQTVLKHGLDPEEGGPFSKPLLHIAAETNSPAITACLLNYGVSPKQPDHHGATAIHIAAACDAVSVLDVFIDYDVAILFTTDGVSPLHEAAWGNADKAVRYLLNQGAFINKRSNKGGTPLHWSVRNNAVSALTSLLDAQANAGIKNKNGQTALDLALTKQSDQCANILLARGKRLTPIGRRELIERLTYNCYGEKSARRIEQFINGNSPIEQIIAIRKTLDRSGPKYLFNGILKRKYPDSSITTAYL